MSYGSQVTGDPISVTDAIASRRGKLSTDYTFDLNARTITINELDYIRPLYIVNATIGAVIYNPVEKSTSGSVSGNVLTLNTRISGMSSNDELVLFYEATDANSADVGNILSEIQTQTPILTSIDTETTSQGTTLDSIETETIDQGTTLDGISSEQLAQGVSLDNIETELTAQGTTLDNIETEQGGQGTTLDSILAAVSLTNPAVNDANSSTSILTAGSTFTGTWVDVSAYKSLTVAVKTDQDGTYTIQFSPDGVNQDSTLTRYYRTSQIEPPHRFTITRKYARVVFNNTSASDQTFFRLQTILGDQGDLNIPLDSVMSQDYDSVSTRPSDYHSEVALNRRQGASLWNKFGYNTDVDTSTSPEIIASWGGTYQFITTGETIDIVSTNAADDGSPAGTGVNSIVVYGVDSNWDEQIEAVTMNGTTTVTTSSTWIGINRIAVFLSGSGRTNAGTITVTATTSGYTMAQMPAGGGVSQQMLFFVPQNHVFLAKWVHFSSRKLSGGGGSPELTFKGQVYSAINNTVQEVYRGEIDVANENNLNVSPPFPFPITEKSILYFTAETDKDNTSVTGRFSGELVRDIDA